MILRQFSGSKLTELRTAAGITRERLAVDTGLSFAAVQQYEIGRSTPRTTNLARLAGRLGCRIDDLFIDVPESAA